MGRTRRGRMTEEECKGDEGEVWGLSCVTEGEAIGGSLKLFVPKHDDRRLILLQEIFHLLDLNVDVFFMRAEFEKYK